MGDHLDATHAAPTSGGPPFEAYEVVPVRAFGFPTAGRREPTRWTWDGAGGAGGPTGTT